MERIILAVLEKWSKLIVIMNLVKFVTDENDL